MAGFRKAKAEQAALKIGLYGTPGSGKTFTSLLMAEGLVRGTNKRIAFVDTERGTDFYCQSVTQRKIHPEPFDFDAIYTKSITEVISAVKSLKKEEHGVVVIDSVTHIWEACMAAYGGNTTRQGSIPAHAWGGIKKPYKELMSTLLSMPQHVIICGRQGNDWDTDENGQMTKVGVKMKAETETPYEPHILIRMESNVDQEKLTHEIRCYVEKDRTGILMGKFVVNPTFDSLCKPLLHLLGDKQAAIKSSDEVAALDAENLLEFERVREQESSDLMRQYEARMKLSMTQKDLEAVSKELTPEIKKKMLTAHTEALRAIYLERSKELSR